MTVRDLGKRLYYYLPPPAQEILISSYFVVKRRRVRNERFAAELRELMQNERADPAAIRALQRRRLKPTLQAAARTPYYRDLFARVGLPPANFDDPSCLARVPILEKAEVRRDPAAFVDPSATDVTVAYTSGSTGSPLRVTLSHDYESIEEAFVARQWTWAGLGARPRCIRLRGDLVVPASSHSTRPWRRNVGDNELRMSSYHLSRATARSYIERINRFRPQALIAYPSSANLLARFVEELGMRCPIPCVFTSSETLSASQRATIERHLEAKVFDHYGCTEASVAMQQCEHGSYHVLPEYGLTELVPADGADADVYDVVSTGLVNTAMPLLRYRTGDRVRVGGTRSCPCRRPFVVVDEIVGRDDDLVLTPRGDLVGRLDHVYKGLTGIAESQIRQESVEQLRILVVPASTYDDAMEAQLVANLRSRLGDMRITVERVAAIPRGANGKFRAVVSTVAGSAR